MADMLRHRGPDAAGCLVRPGIALGFRRLSIIDLTTGDQPICSEDGEVAVVCNGEIYNFLELRSELESRGHVFRTRSDAETIVHLYEDLGADCVTRLRGMFGLALWDGRRKRLMLARDRLGIKPMHYAVSPHRLDFASEEKAILAGSAEIHRAPDPAAIRDLLELGFVAGEKTLVSGVRRLLPGHYLIYERGNLEIRQYWDVSFTDMERNGRAEVWAELLREKLQETVRIHLRSDVPVGAWLSPGIDSSAVAALSGKLSPEPVQSFTLAFEDPSLDETRKFPTLDRYAGKTVVNTVVWCRSSDFALFRKALWHCEEPTSVMIPRMLLAEAAARRVKVVMTGEGADEVLGGYAWYRQDRLFRPVAWLPLWMRRLLLVPCRRLPLWSRSMTQALLAERRVGMPRFRAMIHLRSGGPEWDLFSPEMRELVYASNSDEPPVPIPDAFRRWNAFHQLQYLDMKIRLPELVNHSLDRASMACGLETRVPFLDHELVEFCNRMPISFKVRGLREKYVLREAMRGILPEEILRRRKNGMGAPVRSWWKSPLPDYATEALSPANLQRTGFFNPNSVQQTLNAHRRGEGEYSDFLSTVLAIQLRFGSVG